MYTSKSTFKQLKCMRNSEQSTISGNIQQFTCVRIEGQLTAHQAGPQLYSLGAARTKTNHNFSRPTVSCELRENANLVFKTACNTNWTWVRSDQNNCSNSPKSWQPLSPWAALKLLCAGPVAAKSLTFIDVEPDSRHNLVVYEPASCDWS